jgi:hypothetical protein
MLRIVVATVLLALPLSLSAQTYSRTQTTVSGYSYQTLETSRASLGSRASLARDNNSPDAEQCLSRKKTGRVECHTYAEWVEIARAIEAGRK